MSEFRTRREQREAERVSAELQGHEPAADTQQAQPLDEYGDGVSDYFAPPASAASPGYQQAAQQYPSALPYGAPATVAQASGQSHQTAYDEPVPHEDHFASASYRTPAANGRVDQAYPDQAYPSQAYPSQAYPGQAYLDQGHIDQAPQPRSGVVFDQHAQPYRQPPQPPTGRGRRRSGIALLIGVLVVALGLGGAFLALRPLLANFMAAEDFAGPGTGQVMFSVPDGATGTVIGQKLAAEGVVKSAQAFVDAARADSRSAGIQPGTYELKSEMRAADALEILVDPGNRVVDRAVIKEGQRLAEILPALSESTGIPLADFKKAAKASAAIGLPKQANGRLEGWLFPATYEIDPTMTAESLLASMVQRTVQELEDLGVDRARWNDVIIEASLVEAERGPDPGDAAKIARVFANRMAQDRPLQLDTTVNYALDRRKVAVSIADTKVDSKYNTYKYPGLPIGAICSPGRTAIEAVLNPAEGPWMYFVAVNPDTGETKYATTEAEFWKLSDELNAWLKENPGR